MIEGTEDAFQREFQEVFLDLQGQVGRELRARVREIRTEVEWDMANGGSKVAMDQLITF